MAKQPSFFWPSYSDLMTSLFFVMLVLFILTIGVLVRQVRATQEQLNKIKEIEDAVKELPEEYFEYKEEYKKHVLNLDVWFPELEFRFESIELIRRQILQRELLEAGHIIDSITRIFENRTDVNVQYLVIIEGQASIPYRNPDDYKNNDVLSFQRALSLKEFWKRNGIDLENNPNCELIIAGSGAAGVPREPLERDNLNQRFLIHIIPKPGLLKGQD